MMVVVDPEDLKLVLDRLDLLGRGNMAPHRSTADAYERLRQAYQHDDYVVTLPDGGVIHVFGPDELARLAEVLEASTTLSIDSAAVELPPGATDVRITRWNLLDSYIRPDGTSPWSVLMAGTDRWVPLADVDRVLVHGAHVALALLCLIPQPETVEVPKATLAALLGTLHEGDFHADTVRLLTELRTALEADHA